MLILNKQIVIFFVCKNDFLRLGFTLTKLLAEDAEYLRSNIHREKIEEKLQLVESKIEDKILGAEEKAVKLEQDLFNNLKEVLKDFVSLVGFPK